MKKSDKLFVIALVVIALEIIAAVFKPETRSSLGIVIVGISLVGLIANVYKTKE